MLLITYQTKHNHDITCWHNSQGEEGLKSEKDGDHYWVGCDTQGRINIVEYKVGGN